MTCWQLSESAAVHLEKIEPSICIWSNLPQAFVLNAHSLAAGPAGEGCGTFTRWIQTSGSWPAGIVFWRFLVYILPVLMSTFPQAQPHTATTMSSRMPSCNNGLKPSERMWLCKPFLPLSWPKWYKALNAAPTDEHEFQFSLIWSRSEARASLLSLHDGHCIYHIIFPQCKKVSTWFCLLWLESKRNRNREIILEVIYASMNMGIFDNASSWFSSICPI